MPELRPLKRRRSPGGCAFVRGRFHGLFKWCMATTTTGRRFSLLSVRSRFGSVAVVRRVGVRIGSDLRQDVYREREKYPTIPDRLGQEPQLVRIHPESFPSR